MIRNIQTTGNSLTFYLCHMPLPPDATQQLTLIVPMNKKFNKDLEHLKTLIYPR